MGSGCLAGRWCAAAGGSSVSGAMCEDDSCAGRPPGGQAVSPGERGGCGGDLDQVILLQTHSCSSPSREEGIFAEAKIRKSSVPLDWKRWLVGTGCDTCDKEVEDNVATQLILSRPAVNVIAAPAQRVTLNFEGRPWSILANLIN